MKDITNYEWLVDELDNDGDIVDTEFFNSYSDAVKHKVHAQVLGNNGNNFEIGIIRYVGNDIDGEKDRQYAYMSNNKLPTEMDGGASVPKRFHIEVEKYYR